MAGTGVFGICGAGQRQRQNATVPITAPAAANAVPVKNQEDGGKADSAEPNPARAWTMRIPEI
jgi:hypothetical protein